ncbi:MAG TPA: hypothetical protein VM124_02245 [Candidatus Limnocylindrales bacterium]|nr:hypothetical protein [Candidatus Limnocylindrales bacterium]
MENPELTPQKQVMIKPKKAILPWLFIILLLTASVIGYGLWYGANKKLSQEKTAHNATQKQLSDSNTSLNKAQDRLKAAVFLPDLSNTSPECESGNNDKIRLTPINKDPIDGYKLYLLSCLNQIENKTSLKGELQVYKVNNQGQEEFDFGNGFGEPYCISNKFFSAKTAEKLKNYTGFPACSGYFGT